MGLLVALQAGVPAFAQEEDTEKDPSSNVDPGFDDSRSTLGGVEELFDGDPDLLDSPDVYDKDSFGVEPSEFGFPESFNRAAYDGMSCAAPPTSVTPIGLAANTAANPAGSGKRYFSYTGVPRVLVGASADSACHWSLVAPGGAAIDICNLDNYQLLLCKLHGGVNACNNADPLHPVPNPAPGAPKLNKIRLWVSVAGEANPANVPFGRVTVVEPGPNGRTYSAWNLNARNVNYFDNLRRVVSMAKELGIFVEVTFFAPFEGEETFASSPWYANPQDPTKPKITPNSVIASGAGYVQVGFKPPAGLTGAAAAQAAMKYFVVNDPATTPHDHGMRGFQKNVILWTVDALWCFDNVFWEIANEPEGRTVAPLEVAQWQKDRILELVQKDSLANYPKLTRPHLIAVQPFTTAGYDALKGFLNPAGKRYVSLFNGHYTQALTEVTSAFPVELNLGALQLARAAFTSGLAVGFNETKITPYGGNQGVVAHWNGADTSNLVNGGPEPGRSEGWELLMHQGATYDHWGYLDAGAVTGTSLAIRNQLAKLKSFFDQLVVDRARFERLKASKGLWVVGAWLPSGSWSTPNGTAKPSGLTNYPEGNNDWEAATSSQRYWASLATDPSEPSRQFLLYTHHSTRRCKIRSFVASGCRNQADTGPGPYLGLGGYDARVWTTNPPGGSRYQDKLRVNLGPAAGTFKVEWLEPATLNPTNGASGQVLAWFPAGGGSCPAASPGCILCNNPASCQITSPLYSYDNLLKITQQ